MLVLGLVCGGGGRAEAGGVTVITHGFAGNVTDWIIPMADRWPGHPAYPGSDWSCYQISVTAGGVSAQFLGGVAPTESVTGEIFVKLDWSTLAGLFGASSTDVAQSAVEALLSTTLLPELGGRALAELPLHLIGHSRGGSVVTEMARFLGAEGVWVDQVTTLDPRPTFDDAAVATWANVLYADNYWQTLGDGLFVPNGQSLAGAYNRQLTALDGGYSSSHSDVHLWYHGTIELGTPATDSMANITAAERAAWWTAAEAAGAATGFLFSRIGGGDRLSAAEPGGAGMGRVSDGFNRRWDLGGGVASNRTALPANSGAWPNAIVLEVAGGAGGAPLDLELRHQSGAAATGEAELVVLLDPDRNPWNGNETEIDRRMVPNSGTGQVALSQFSVTLDGGVAPGTYAVLARIGTGARTRVLHAAAPISVGSTPVPPTIDPASIVVTGTELRFDVRGTPGQQVAVQASAGLADWPTIETRTLTEPVWTFVDANRAAFPNRFYRVVLVE